MNNSEQIFARSQAVIPGGVNSPVRAFSAVGGEPVVFAKALGSQLIDTDGKSYTDFVLSWGPAILGHSAPRVVKAVQEQAADGFSFGMPSEIECELAELMVDKIDGIEKIRFVSSGTEATMSAIRLARGFTGKDTIIKYEGCYHGHSDGLLVKAGSGVSTFGEASSAGVPEGYVQYTRSVVYNDLEATRAAFEAGDVAAVILEPVPGNMGLILPSKEFIHGLRALCDEFGALLIFDEVMCGFRVSATTAAALYQVTPDLICFGKVIGGGLPVGAFGGKAEIMNKLAPLGPVYQAGTLSGNPLAMRAGIETIKEIFEVNAWETLQKISASLEEKVAKVIAGRKDVCFIAHGAMFTLFFRSELPNNMDEVSTCDFDRFGRFFRFMLERGSLIPPSQYEANFLSIVHTDEQMQKYADDLAVFLDQEGL